MNPRILLALLLVVPFVVPSAPAMAGDDDCANAMTQRAMNECAAADLARADAALNDTWREVMAALAGRPQALRSLRASQRQWIRLRDADMAALFPLEAGEDLRTQYGSIQPLEFAQ